MIAKAKNEFGEQINGISRSLEVYRFLLKKNPFGQSPFLITLFILFFPKMIYKFMEWSFHLELTIS